MKQKLEQLSVHSFIKQEFGEDTKNGNGLAGTLEKFKQHIIGTLYPEDPITPEGLEKLGFINDPTFIEYEKLISTATGKLLVWVNIEDDSMGIGDDVDHVVNVKFIHEVENIVQSLSNS